MFHVSRFTPHVSRFKFIALFILLTAAAFRLVLLHDLPPGLAQDEVLDADIALFIRQGHHALFFREGYGHEPLYHYLAVPLQILLGDNVLSMRLTAVFLGLILIALTMGWARREFGSVTAVVVGVGLAVSWWPIIFSRIGIRPILLPVLLLLMAWCWPRRPWLAGLFLGLTLYSYTAARVVFLIPILLFFYSLLVENKPRQLWNRLTPSTASVQSLRASIIVLFTAVLIYLPLHLTLRADPTLQQRVEQLEGPLTALRQGDAQPVFEMTLATLGVFTFTGDPRWTYSLPGRPLFDPLTALFFYGGLLLALSRARRQPTYAFILFWLAVTLVPSALTPDAPSTVRLIGALPVIYLLPGIAISWIFKQRSRLAPYAFHLLLSLLLALMLGVNVARTVRDGFVIWPAEIETRFRYQTIFLDIARHWRDHPAGGLVIADGWYEPIDHDTVRRNLGREVPARWVQAGGAVVFPVGGNGRFYVPEFAPPDPYLLALAAWPADPIYRSPDQPSFVVYALAPTPSIPLLETAVTFDHKITLLGYELLPVVGDGSLTAVTYWRVEASLPGDLAAFMHLLGEGDQPVAQHDGLDVAPTRLEPGDTFIQLHRITLPEERPLGPYTLQIGLYLRHEGHRLTHSGQPADRLLLEQGLIFDEN